MRQRNVVELKQQRAGSRVCLFFVAIALCGGFVAEIGADPNEPPSPEQMRNRQTLREAIRTTMFRDPEVRENHIVHGLKYCGGHDAQVLRLLWLVRESEPALRKELLLQWLLEKKELPEVGRVKEHVQTLSACYAAPEISKRVLEVDEVFAAIESEREARIGLVKTIDDANQLILSRLDENILLSEPNEPNSIAARQAMYTELPTVERIEQDPDVSDAILLSLWLIESNQTLRDEFLWSRIEHLSHVRERSMPVGPEYLEYLAPLIKDMKDSQKGARIVNLEALKQ